MISGIQSALNKSIYSLLINSRKSNGFGKQIKNLLIASLNILIIFNYSKFELPRNQPFTLIIEVLAKLYLKFI